MNEIHLPEFHYLQTEGELINPSRFWFELINSRIDINHSYAERLISWCEDCKSKLDTVSQDACSESYEVRHLLDCYLKSSEQEANHILTVSRDLTGPDGSIRSLKKLTSTNRRGVSSEHKDLSRELLSLTERHLVCLKHLQDVKENGIMVMAASRNYERRITVLKAVLEKVGKKSKKSILEKKVRTLESKLGKHNRKELTHKVHYQRLLQEESELVNKLRKTSDHACQEACALQKSQLESLVSSLRDFVVKTCSSDNDDRTSFLKNTIDNIAVNDIVNATCDLTSKKYVFPDVQAWHRKFGFLEKIPTSFIRASDVSIRRDLKKGLTEENRLAQEVMSAIGQPVHSRRCWISKSRTKNGDDGDINNNETVAGTSHAAVEDDVKYTEDVYVRVVRPFKPTHPEHLQLSLGMRIKQKFPVDVRGMSFGWCRCGLVGQNKQYGFYPADHVILET
ncbi:uncharacterized protein LOC124138929 [Haliotis rufescens]|uniref:uncharacterized protein LOC124138929 n=1 Tax=Haliotis rufescens TaxID=6454 RepID=UPI00201EC92F|nr:uncharacterized protein LOC124138929 [Haliotis rufescens]